MYRDTMRDQLGLSSSSSGFAFSRHRPLSSTNARIPSVTRSNHARFPPSTIFTESFRGYPRGRFHLARARERARALLTDRTMRGAHFQLSSSQRSVRIFPYTHAEVVLGVGGRGQRSPIYTNTRSPRTLGTPEIASPR